MRREYSIPFIGLKNGKHKFDFEVGSDFFEGFEKPLVGGACEITVDLVFDKSDSLFVLEFKIDGTVELECDRCTENYSQNIFGDYTVFVKFDENNKEDEEDVIYISRDDTHLDVRKLIYDYINLSIPMKRTHPLDGEGNSTCDPTIIEILEKSSRADKETETDPRWDVLKKVKTKK